MFYKMIRQSLIVVFKDDGHRGRWRDNDGMLDVRGAVGRGRGYHPASLSHEEAVNQQTSPPPTPSSC